MVKTMDCPWCDRPNVDPMHHSCDRMESDEYND